MRYCSEESATALYWCGKVVIDRRGDQFVCVHAVTIQHRGRATNKSRRVGFTKNTKINREGWVFTKNTTTIDLMDPARTKKRQFVLWVLLSYGFNSYRLRVPVNKLELELVPVMLWVEAICTVGPRNSRGSSRRGRSPKFAWIFPKRKIPFRRGCALVRTALPIAPESAADGQRWSGHRFHLAARRHSHLWPERGCQIHGGCSRCNDDGEERAKAG